MHTADLDLELERLIFVNEKDEEYQQYMRAVEKFNATGEILTLANSLKLLGDKYFLALNFRSAANCYLNASRLFWKTDQYEDLVHVIFRAGTCFRTLGSHTQTIMLFEQLEKVGAVMESPRIMAYAHDAIASMLMYDEQYANASNYSRSSQSYYYNAGQPAAMAACLLDEARCLRATGKYEQALNQCKNSYRIFRSCCEIGLSAVSLLHQAYCLIMLEQIGEAKKMVQISSRIFESFEEKHQGSPKLPFYRHNLCYLSTCVGYSPAFLRIEYESKLLNQLLHLPNNITGSDIDPMERPLMALSADLFLGGLCTETALVTDDMSRIAERYGRTDWAKNLLYYRSAAQIQMGTPSKSAETLERCSNHEREFNDPWAMSFYHPETALDIHLINIAKLEGLTDEIAEAYWKLEHLMWQSQYEVVIEEADRLSEQLSTIAGGWRGGLNTTAEEQFKALYFPFNDDGKNMIGLLVFRCRHWKARALAQLHRIKDARSCMEIVVTYLLNCKESISRLFFNLFAVRASIDFSLYSAHLERFNDAKEQLENIKSTVKTMGNNWIMADWWLAKMRLALAMQDKHTVSEAAVEQVLLFQDLIKNSRTYPGELQFADHIQNRLKEIVDSLQKVKLHRLALKISLMRKMFRMSTLCIGDIPEDKLWCTSKEREEIANAIQSDKQTSAIIRNVIHIAQDRLLRSSLQTVKITTEGSIQNLLDPDEAIADFHFGDECPCIFLMRGCDQDFVCLPLDSLRVKDFMSSCSKIHSNWTHEHLIQIWDVFIEQLAWAAEQYKINKLSLVSGVATHDMPLHAAFDNKRTKKYLFELFELAYLPQQTLRTTLVPRIAKPETGLFVCNPRPYSKQTLPMTALEAQLLSSQLTHTEILRGQEATVERIAELWGHQDIVVVSAHGESKKWDGLLSYVQLHKDDILMGVDVLWGLPRLKAGAIVIANCCHTAAVDTRESVEAQGLAVSLLLRGASNVVANAWEVDDIAAMVFADAFINALAASKSSGLAYREAIHAVQGISRSSVKQYISQAREQLQKWDMYGEEEEARLAIMAKASQCDNVADGAATVRKVLIAGQEQIESKREYSDPYIWAPFILMGRL